MSIQARLARLEAALVPPPPPPVRPAFELRYLSDEELDRYQELLTKTLPAGDWSRLTAAEVAEIDAMAARANR